MQRFTLLTVLSAALLAGCNSLSTTPPPPDPPPPTSGMVPAQDYNAAAGAFGAPPADAAQMGQWSNVIPNWPALAIHTTLLPDGSVITFGGNNYPNWQQYAGKTNIQYPNKVDVWNPATNSHTDASYIGSSLFCGGHTLLPDGRLLVTGGDDLSKLSAGGTGGGTYSAEAGIRETHIYDYRSKSWVKGQDMTDKRWYPTNIALPSGDVLVMGGNRENNSDLSDLPEVFNWQSGQWRALTGAQQKTEFYPWLFLLSDGRVINVGGGKYMSDSGTTTGLYDVNGAGSFTPYDRGDNRYRDYGTAVMYAPDKILVIGGGGDANVRFNPQPQQPPTNTALVISYDPNTKQASKGVPTGSMKVGRRMATSTLLPDGTVLVTGGTSGIGFSDYRTAVHDTELWNPASGQFTSLARMDEARVYHSTALLLPDASVLVSGGGAYSEQPSSGYDTWRNAQVFKPPYLFKGPRPSIKSVSSAVVAYNSTFDVTTANAADAPQIDKATLVRLGSVTHAFNMNQRINDLNIVSQGNGKLTLRAPASANLAPPGQYMLFVLKNGVPSVARILTLK